MSSAMQPRLAITMGDPAGVGAEICVKTLVRPAVYAHAQPFVIGDIACLRLAMDQTGIHLPLRKMTNIDDLQAQAGVIQVLEAYAFDAGQLVMGAVSQRCGHAAVQYFETAVNLALAGQIQGVVTCPINKEAVHAAGYVGDIGHQEILARMTGAGLTATLLMTQGLKVAHLSTHKSLAEAVAYVRRPVLVEKLQLTHDSLSRWCGRPPKIAVAALNPHGGEGGMLGREEIDEIAPAVAEARALGLDVVGPYPADSVFYRAVNGEFDAVLALYHDQGHIAIKMHNFADSITATMGIPFIRTSVDHGTAFDIAGKNLANADSLSQAIDAAIAMMNGNLSS
ncbi:MAG: 4-hydroxythreonine-4-phosphate dehydrogenase PdxA [SAR86 cluster bacterium]|jgi:4-phospho-D-threonate 3-dehydrogenase / 4-phospho-D-erythronate 3-dehydrogenase|uniref:4-hydroxythreonine-4-phosphate dehydrogenase PdxA n=1 Tax=SAR86 cluster bacterium TaxID=2030880 RepID=A0A973A7B5_9GAMM|nr:4-hydroxythreonine-4-phosphate dehydrogenase PdxA [SAR86 cluster bacterium]